MSDEKRCDLCRTKITDGVRYTVDRYDEYGHYDSLDICSAECLAMMATGEAHERGAREENAAVQRKLDVAPRKVRKWWRR